VNDYGNDYLIIEGCEREASRVPTHLLTSSGLARTQNEAKESKTYNDVIAITANSPALLLIGNTYLGVSKLVKLNSDSFINRALRSLGTNNFNYIVLPIFLRHLPAIC